ncbi:MAG: DNA-3-methyladenine glycosylase 2 family protein [Planctomycetota bacterium]|nr:DNA-3-methyladenine glycosylase 2 family protein [Planctomycetota bacterium]
MSARETSTITKIWSAGIRHLRQVDPPLARVITDYNGKPLEIQRRRSPFEYLLRSIIFQQLSGKAAGTIHGRFLTLFPMKRATPERVLQLRPARYRKVGVSGGKERAIRDLARHARDGSVPGFAALERMDDEQIIETITEIHGIGRWTVQMLLIFQLGRPDVLPVDDLGVRKGFARMRGKKVLPTPKQLTRAAQKWQPYRSIGSWYCWRATEM